MTYSIIVSFSLAALGYKCTILSHLSQAIYVNIECESLSDLFHTLSDDK
jgi:hypothetical protein